MNSLDISSQTPLSLPHHQLYHILTLNKAPIYKHSVYSSFIATPWPSPSLHHSTHHALHMDRIHIPGIRIAIPAFIIMTPSPCVLIKSFRTASSVIRCTVHGSLIFPDSIESAACFVIFVYIYHRIHLLALISMGYGLVGPRLRLLTKTIDILSILCVIGHC